MLHPTAASLLRQISTIYCNKLYRPKTQASETNKN